MTSPLAEGTEPLFRWRVADILTLTVAAAVCFAAQRFNHELGRFTTSIAVASIGVLLLYRARQQRYDAAQRSLAAGLGWILLVWSCGWCLVSWTGTSASTLFNSRAGYLKTTAP